MREFLSSFFVQIVHQINSSVFKSKSNKLSGDVLIFQAIKTSVADPYHFDADPDPRKFFDSVNLIFPIKCYARSCKM